MLEKLISPLTSASDWHATKYLTKSSYYLPSDYLLSKHVLKRMFYLKMKIWNALFLEIFPCELFGVKNASVD